MKNRKSSTLARASILAIVFVNAPFENRAVAKDRGHEQVARVKLSDGKVGLA